MDEFDLDSFEDSEEPSAQQERNNPVRQLRETLKQRDKEAKALSKELEELRKFREEVEYTNRITKMSESFTKLGLTDKHVELYTKLNPEGLGTPEEIVAFAREYSLPVKLEQDDEDQSLGTPFRPADGGDQGDGYISRADLEKLYAENPAKAIKVLQSGRVQWNNKLD